MIWGRLATSSVITAATVLGLGQIAKAEIFDIGSTFTVSNTTSAGTYSDTVTLQNGTSLIDNGALDLTISIVDGPGSNEWLVLSYQTVSGPLMSSTSEDWESSQTGITVNPSIFDAAFIEFLNSSGSALTPMNGIFPGFSVEANPVPSGSGTGVGSGGFNAPVSGPLGELFAALDPFDQLDSDGITSTNVQGFVQAYEFSPASVPEPASLLLMSTVLLGVVLVARKRLISRA